MYGRTICKAMLRLSWQTVATKPNNFVLMLNTRPNEAGGRPLALNQLIQSPWEHGAMLS